MKAQSFYINEHNWGWITGAVIIILIIFIGYKLWDGLISHEDDDDDEDDGWENPISRYYDTEEIEHNNKQNLYENKRGNIGEIPL